MAASYLSRPDHSPELQASPGIQHRIMHGASSPTSGLIKARMPRRTTSIPVNEAVDRLYLGSSLGPPYVQQPRIALLADLAQTRNKSDFPGTCGSSNTFYSSRGREVYTEFYVYGVRRCRNVGRRYYGRQKYTTCEIRRARIGFETAYNEKQM